ncbi:hypothetical protein B9Z55_004459 [Caenorhabditis nigoni]|uniref:C6 domain-containing protein n=1 Tax=Caenorhabditis nigoni TaxID=1611254 RepID=A0A2G5UWE7_9PELO|nr:hypothetical protein B9Z55_004459 [Caenorhabditis nigoni]
MKFLFVLPALFLVFISNDAQETSCQTCADPNVRSAFGITATSNVTSVDDCAVNLFTLTFPTTDLTIAVFFALANKTAYAVTDYVYYNVSHVFMCSENGKWQYEIEGKIYEGFIGYNYRNMTGSHGGCNAKK